MKALSQNRFLCLILSQAAHSIEETVISPSALFSSPLLETVAEE